MGDTSAVGSYPAGASPYGALDMAGNVSEYVADFYQDEYWLGEIPTRNPSGPTTGPLRVMRGGSFFMFWFDMRTAARWHAEPKRPVYAWGFRCARSQ